MARLPSGGHARRNRNSPLAHAAAAGNRHQPGPEDPFDRLRHDRSQRSLPGSPTPGQPAGQKPVPPTPASVSTSTGAAPPPSAEYDLNTDPVLQQIKAAAAAADAAAQGRALAAQQQELLAYGDPALAAAKLGADDPFVKAASQNQESTLSRLKRGYDEGLHGFDNTLDPSLVFSGARIKGEGQIGQRYQDSLASAAAGVQSRLGSIQDMLDEARAADADKIAAGYTDAYNRRLNAALMSPPATLADAAAGG